MVDANNLDRLQALISLKSRCLYWAEFCKYTSKSTFFSDLNDEINMPLIYILNDEFTNISGRDEIDLLIRKCTDNNKYFDYLEINNSNYDHELVHNDLKDIYVWQTDNQNHMAITRFIVNAFSVFEFWVCKAYDVIKSRYKSKNSKMKKLESQLNKYVESYNSNDNEALELIKNEIFTKTNSYVSSREKIDFVLSKIDFVNLKNDKKLDKAKELVSFLFNFRNTIHNVMVNKSGKDFKIETNGATVELLNDSSPNYEDYAKFIHSMHLLVDLYSDLFMYLSKNIPDFHEFTNEF
ncbi:MULTISPECIES: hypothetical protein [Shewanella]|uniref:DUF4435 domain-containing protein n=1 Tax=Shewanella vaxholmensis TaxID=3063535 RepID=A0ABU9UQS7_9GAMM|nr:hypothetical protein [Shewanella sp. SP2S2-6]MDT3297742.1 hypothetical protein [Shewanella sp. SP2S2-6]